MYQPLLRAARLLPLLCTLLALVPAARVHAQYTFPTFLPEAGTFIASSSFQTFTLDTGAVPAGTTYFAYQLSFEWELISGALPANCRVLLSSTAVNSGTSAPALPNFAYANITSFSVNTAGGITTVSSNQNFAVPYTSGNPLHFVFRQTAGSARWRNVVLTLSSGLPAPTNDRCSGALVLDPSTFPLVTSPQAVRTADVAQNFDPAIGSACQPASRRTLWYTFIAPDAASYTVSTCTGDAPLGTVSDTIIEVFVTDPLLGCAAINNESRVSCVDDTSGCAQRTRASFFTIPGARYFIQIGRLGLSTPSTSEVMQFRIERTQAAPPPPVNQVCSGAVVINPASLPFVTAPVALVSSNMNATPGISCEGSNERPVWFAFTPTVTSYYEFSTCQSDAPSTTIIDTVMGVFRAEEPCDPGMVLVGCNDDSCGQQARVRVPLQAGKLHYIIIARYALTPIDATEINVQLRVSQYTPPAPTNDTCANAISLTGFILPITPSAVNPFNASLSTAGDPPFPCAPNVAQTVWYTFTPDSTGQYEVSSCPAVAPAANIADTAIAIVSGPCAGPFTIIACNDNDSTNDPVTNCGTRARARATLIAGVTYRIVIGRANSNIPPSPFENATQIRITRVGNALETPFGETEPNDSRAQATPVTLSGTQAIQGTCLGSDTSGLTTSQDIFLLSQPAATPVDSITRVRVTISSLTPGHTLELLGRSQLDGVIGADPTSNPALDAVVLAASSTGVLTYYQLPGGTSPAYLRVRGDTTTSLPYTLTISRTDLPAPALSANLRAGTVIFSTQGRTGADTELWLFDTNFVPLVGMGNDDESPLSGGSGTTGQSRLVRTLDPGQYILVVAPANLAHTLPSPSDDDQRSRPVLDVPGVLAVGGGNSGPGPFVLNTAITDSIATTELTATASSATDLAMFRIVVDAPTLPGCSPADIANTDGDPVSDNVLDNGDFILFFQAFFADPTDPLSPRADIANTDAEVAPVWPAGTPSGGPDGVIDNGDFIAFFTFFFQACF